MRGWLRKLAHADRGAVAIEYGLIIALIVIVMIVALVEVADTNTEIWTNVAERVVNA